MSQDKLFDLEEMNEYKQDYYDRVNSSPKSNRFVDIYNTDKKFKVIYADPPWKYNDKQDTKKLGGALKHYDLMSIKELCEMPIKEIADDNSVLFMWTTAPLLEESFDIVKAWGFKYKTNFVWDKVRHNMGHYSSVRHEHLLLCTRGRCPLDNRKLIDSVQSIEKTKRHSEKPIEFLNLIDLLYKGNRWRPKIELFAREAKKPNWHVYGNEI